MDLDMRTAVFLCVISYVVCTLCITQLWRQNRKQYDGIDFWAVNFALQTVALLLIVLRGVLPDWMSITLAGALALTGALLTLMGLERFTGKVASQRHNYVLLALFIAAMAYYSSVRPDLAMRNLLYAVSLLVICGQSIWLLRRRVDPPLLPLTSGVAMVLVGYCLLSLLRIGEYLVGGSSGEDFFQAGLSRVLMMVGYQTLSLLLTYSLILMVNQRLLMDIGGQRSKFAAAFHAAPFAIALTRRSDAAIIDVNQNFSTITGYSRAEVIGRRSLELNLWERAEDRAAVVEVLARRGEVAGMEVRFRTKAGDPVVGLFSAHPIEIDGEPAVISCVADMTERKAAELALQAQSQAMQERSEELDRFNRLAVGRELDMIRLKQQVNEMSLRLGLAPPYAIDFAATPASETTD